MMNRWNLQNPLVKVMVDYYTELESKTYEYVKKCIITSLLSVLISIIVVWFLYNHNVSVLYYILFAIIVNVTLLHYTKSVVAIVKKNEVKDIILGDTFANIDVNNEKLFSIMCTTKELNGKVIVFELMHRIILFIYFIASILYLLSVYI